MAELVIALDVDGIEDMSRICAKTGDAVEWFKIGSVLFSKYGPETVHLLKKNGKKVFLDLKYHDIPNTVAGAVKNAVSLGVDMVNVHASGGLAMMKAAVDAAKSRRPETLVIAVTVLTSFDQASFSMSLNREGGYTIADHVRYLAEAAREAGMDGVVCSSHELEMIKKACGAGFVAVVPGIRPSWELAADDQRRVMTPGMAVRLGADYLVVGRPVLKADNPAEAAIRIFEEMERP